MRLFVFVRFVVMTDMEYVSERMSDIGYDIVYKYRCDLGKFNSGASVFAIKKDVLF